MKLMYCNDMSGTNGSFDKKKYKTIKELIKTCEYSERKYRTLYEESPDLHRTVNLKRIIIDCNYQYADSLGYEKKEVIGKSIFEHTAEKSIKDMRDTFEEWKTTGTIKNKRIWMKRKDNSIFPSLLSISSIKDDHGRTIATNAIIRDITELYAARKKLEESENSYKIQYKKLNQIQKEKNDLFSMISHDMKNPLVPILGYSEMLLDDSIGPLNDEQKKFVEMINSSSKRLEFLTEQIALIQKLDMGVLSSETKAINVKDAMQEIFELNLPLVKEKKIKFVNLTKQNNTIQGDIVMLHRILTNLIHNAVDFVSESGSIEINAISKEQNVLFFIKDDGIGIPKEKQSQIFQRFFKINTQTKRQYGGTGLGLAICKKLVEDMNGKIWVESEEGKGSTFYFSIPKN